MASSFGIGKSSKRYGQITRSGYIKRQKAGLRRSSAAPELRIKIRCLDGEIRCMKLKNTSIAKRKQGYEDLFDIFFTLTKPTLK